MKLVQSQQALADGHTIDNSPINHDDVGLIVDVQPTGIEQASVSSAAEEITVSHTQYMSQVPTYYVGPTMVSPAGYYFVPVSPTGPAYPQRFNFLPAQSKSTQTSPAPSGRYPLPGL